MRRPEIQPGGLCLTAFARWEDVSTWPRENPETGVLDTAIVLREGRTWFRLNAPDRGRMFSEKPGTDIKGKYFDITVQGDIPGDNVTLHFSAQTMRYHQYVLLVKDRSGLYKLIGNKDSGADFSFDYTSGDGATQRKRSLTFSWQSPEPAPVYLGPEAIVIDDAEYTLPVASQGDFNEDFSDDFFNNP